MKKCSLKKIPLGWPLTLAAAGTVAGLWLGGKQVHVACGVAWAALSALHGWQHMKSLQNDLRRLGACLSPTAGEGRALKRLLATFTVAAYVPGRVRLYSPALIKNEALSRQLTEYIGSFTGVSSVTIGQETGSLLINYCPGKLRAKAKLAKLEACLQAKAVLK